jgi:hypothetical protein
MRVFDVLFKWDGQDYFVTVRAPNGRTARLRAESAYPELGRSFKAICLMLGPEPWSRCRTHCSRVPSVLATR